MAEYSPMMKQYLETKQEYPDCVVFYRVGDFYEMFFEDAVTVSKELELTLTGKNCGKDERAPMCGVPFHAMDTYLNRLTEKGFKVAICDQVEDPKLAKGLVQREVTRVVTPGTNLSSTALDDNKHNYICGIFTKGTAYGLSIADVSTGFFSYTTLFDKQEVLDELIKFAPSEVVANQSFFDESMLIEQLQMQLRLSVSVLPPRYFREDAVKEILLQHFHASSLLGLGMEADDAGTIASGSLFRYLIETQKNDLSHITQIKPYQTSSFMILDSTARRNLELTETMREKRTHGSLLWILDKTKTAMGARMLRSWIEQPLLDVAQITKRQDAVESFLIQMMFREEIREYLGAVYDLERLMGRVIYKSANPRDLLALRSSLEYLPAILDLLSEFDDALIAQISEELDPLQDLYQLITDAISEDAPISVHEGRIINDGYLEQIDEYRTAATEGKNWLAKVEEEEREKTGIKNLRIKYNKVFGYYLEVTNSYLNLVPEYFIRKQTLTNAERFVTPQLKELEDKILGAQDKLTSLEFETFQGILASIAGEVTRIQKTAQALSTLDALMSLALVAERNRYCKPVVVNEDVLSIEGGRHPVVEQTLTSGLFIENDTDFSIDDHRISLITGPNMAGKSTYMRQVALIVLMAQIGSFIPATSATIGIVDRIFTRVGASDDLASGQSTFMLEMNEVANILKNATNRSLIIMDEIGRGTSTYDGLSIAWAVAEYISTTPQLCAKTLFATHYHELTELEHKLDNVKNYHISVLESGEDIIFLRKIVRGGADRSYGIQVARLAGIPEQVTDRAKEILHTIIHEKEEEEKEIPPIITQYEKPSGEHEAVIEEIRNMNLNGLTPLEAMNILFELQNKIQE